MRVLIVEDEVRLAATLERIMKEQKYQCDTVYDGEDGLLYAQSDIYDIIVLDVMLPKLNGFDIIKQLREKKIKTPVILLTAKDSVRDKVMGLDCGADDYLAKPFSTEELLARIRALSRRKGEVVVNVLTYSDLSLDVSTYNLCCGEKNIRLGYKEYEIMKLLMSNGNRIVQKEDILTKVWGYDSNAEDNNVEVYISFLRKKLTFLPSKVNIVTVRKIGYHLES